MSSKVLVTGGSGYLGTRLIAGLLRDGREVRAAVRSLDGEAVVREAVCRGGVDDTGLELVEADQTSDEAGRARSKVWRKSTTSRRRSRPPSPRTQTS